MLNRLKDVFASLKRNDVHYLVIGGIAAVLHGVPRATFDLDILIEATEGNARRLLVALQEAHFGTAFMIDAQKLVQNEITIFKDRVRIDVQTVTPGIQFSTCWPRRMTMTYQCQDFFVLSRQDLIASKRAAGRKVDLEDLQTLGEESPAEPD